MGPTGESFGTKVTEEELTCSTSDGLEGRGEPDIEERGGGCTYEEVSVVMWELTTGESRSQEETEWAICMPGKGPVRASSSS